MCLDIYKKILEKNFFFEKTKSIIIGKKVANKKDQKSNEFVKISLNILWLKIIPTNKDLEKSMLGKNNNPMQRPIVIKIIDLDG